ncbi:MAG: hypothetical protein FP831_07745 [Anaerolineae bacterium]|nr:hypothetical protein [Anaerolineae bacterium]
MIEISTLNKTRKRWFLLFIVIIPLMVLLAACSGTQAKAAKEPTQALPPIDVQAEIFKAPANVQAAYQFAITNPDALKNVPCYCGCGAVGHTSNYSCYVKEVKPSGDVVYDPHSLYCYLCVQINEDTQKMTKEGITPAEIRTTIDATYSKYGKSNMPPVK